MIDTTIKLDRTLQARIETIAEERGVTVSEAMVKALTVYADSWEAARAPALQPTTGRSYPNSGETNLHKTG